MKIDWFRTAPGGWPSSASLASSPTASVFARSVIGFRMRLRIETKASHSSLGTQSGKANFARPRAVDGEALASSSSMAVAVEVLPRYSSVYSAVSVFFVLSQRFAILSRCDLLRFFAASRSFVSRFCFQVLLRPSRVQNSITTGLISAHSSALTPASRARNRSSSGRSQFGRRHASMRRSRYAPCSSVERCRVSERYASVQRVRAGNCAIRYSIPRRASRLSSGCTACTRRRDYRDGLSRRSPRL